MSVMTKLRATKPRRGKLLSTIGHVLPTKHTELKHLPGRQLRFEIIVEVFANWFSAIVDVEFLH